MRTEKGAFFMANYNDQHYLLTRQYKDSSNLQTRMNLHERFSVNKYDWQRWVFDQLDIALDSSVLELGTGPGKLWRTNLERIPATWQVVISDLSPGMLQEAEQHLSGRTLAFQVIDAHSLPFADATLDAVIANHMLYHVPNLSQALSEIQRVLKPGGCLYAATNGQDHLREFDVWQEQLLPDLKPEDKVGGISFKLENGRDLLAPFFEQIDVRLYEDALEVTEVEPLIAYGLSSLRGSDLSEAQIAEFRTLVERDMARSGSIHITKSTGIFIARKAVVV
jgi:ubiquinone/menaquinone biosynthesis C-methylase UbiE